MGKHKNRHAGLSGAGPGAPASATGGGGAGFVLPPLPDAAATPAQIALEREKLALERERLVHEREKLSLERDRLSATIDAEKLARRFSVPPLGLVFIAALAVLAGFGLGSMRTRTASLALDGHSLDGHLVLRAVQAEGETNAVGYLLLLR